MKKTIMTFGLILAAVMISVGIILPVPDTEISGGSYSSRSDGKYLEYVGGDAYNIQIEASIRGGEISGRTAAKTILLTGGAILFVLTLFAGGVLEALEQHNQSAYEIKKLLENSAQSSPKAPSAASSTADLKPAAPVPPPPSETWKCEKCGTTNGKHDSFCSNCGSYK